MLAAGGGVGVVVCRDIWSTNTPLLLGVGMVHAKIGRMGWTPCFFYARLGGGG